MFVTVYWLKKMCFYLFLYSSVDRWNLNSADHTIRIVTEIFIKWNVLGLQSCRDSPFAIIFKFPTYESKNWEYKPRFCDFTFGFLLLKLWIKRKKIGVLNLFYEKLGFSR